MTTLGTDGQASPLSALAPLLRGHPGLADVLGRSSATLAASESVQPFVLAGLAHFSGLAPMLVVTPTVADAERLVDDLRCFFPDTGADIDIDTDGARERAGAQVGRSVELFAPWETLPLERVSPDVHTMGARLAVLWRLFGDEPVPGDPGLAIVVAPVRAVLQRLGPWRHAARPIVVRRGERLEQGELLARLIAHGYRREHQVEHRGEVAVRGGIVDVFPSTADGPIRIDLFGDEVDRLTTFDIGDQRSVADLDEAVIFGCREMVLTDAMRARSEELAASGSFSRGQWERLAEGEVFDGMEAWLPWLAEDETLLTDLLGPGAQVVLTGPRRLRDRAVEVYDEEGALTETLADTWGARDPEAGPLPRLHLAFDRLLAHTYAAVLSLPPVAEGPDVPTVAGRGLGAVAGDAGRLAAQLVGLSSEGYSVVLCTSSSLAAARLSDVLAGEGVGARVAARADTRPGITIVVAPLSAGFVLDQPKVAVLAESDITGRRSPHRRPRPRARPTDGFFDDLAPGSYVVHRQHGVARYAGVSTRTVLGATRDYLVLEYRGSDRLYLPVDQIDAVTPYTGGETPTLSKMGGADWQRTRARARAAAGEIAQELVDLYRARASVAGHAFPPDTVWQHELEAAFPYVETADQLRAIADVKADMESDRPMDRLICGDVGFGKTEVALRAVFKAVQDGRQAAILVPTTLLASQHFQTFSDRYRGFPVRVEMLSRFLSGPQAAKVVEGLLDGSVDVVVGTHRLLAEDVHFKRLGLLVVDEEQRFGVSHKEAVKAMSHGVDVLTLTASPIPRTLEMALTGIRDLSMVNTPPSDRRPILTYVGEEDESAVSEAIRRELLREGQAFYLHNRVADIDAVARHLSSVVPEARIAIAHGQMDEGSLEQVVLDFWDQKYDVLVCTTIIESGIDMPTVNTLVVDRADLLGLGQLHQIRGRVGRAGQRAYAYLFHPAERVLTEAAYERLRTIGEHTELGSGFKIAMRDLQIRGAGNLLGRDQSGHIAAVGYDLYVQMVAEAVAEAKGEREPEPASVAIDVPGDAHLPSDYVEAEDARLEGYRRLAAARRIEEVDDVASEWVDRYGPLPPAAEGLLEVARLRATCLRIGVTEVTVSSNRGAVRHPLARISGLKLAPSAQARLHRLARDAAYREALDQLIVPLAAPAGWTRELRELLEGLVPAPAETAG
jgi:transcription-repair coupling factor (superfamily II helicase)